MDKNNWTVQGGEPSMDINNWRDTLQQDSRQRIINKIMDTLKKHLPCSGQDGLLELRKIAVRFEEKIYASATSQPDYLRKISLKMLSMETKSQTTIANSVGNGNRPPDAVASLGMPTQVQNQGQSIPMQLAANPTQRQQLLSQNIHNAAGVQSSSTLSSALPPASNLTQTSIPSTVGQSSNMQNMSGTTQNSGGNSMGQGLSSNMFANSQRQIPGRQQVVPQQQQQQSQNNQQYLYQQHMQHQLLNPKFQQGNIPQSMMQNHIQQQQQPQQQNLLQQSQLQSSQQTVMSASSAMQPSLSNLQQNQQSSVQQTTKSMLQQHPQSMLRQPQQAAVVHQQQTTVPQQSMMLSQEQQQQQQQIMGQQSNSANMQQNHLIGPQNNVGDMQQQQQRRLLSQQNNLPNLPQQQQQQHLVTQQNNLSNMHQQQLGSQSNVTGLQQQLLGTQPGNSSMQNNEHSMHMLQQSKASSQQQSLHNASSLLPTQGQQPQPQPQPSQQQLLSQMQSQSTQMQQQPNQLQRDVQQRLLVPGQASSPLIQQQNVSDQQKQLYQSQIAIPETSSTSLDSTAQTGGDWQEEIFQKMKAMREMYLPDLNDVYQRIAAKLREHDSVPGQPKTEQLEKLRAFKTIMERTIQFLQVPKSSILPGFKERLASCEKQIINFITTNRPRRSGSMQQQGQLPPSHMHSMQQPPSQINQVQSHENQLNSQLHSINPQGSVATMQQNNMTSLQQSSTSSLSGVSATQQNMMNSLQPSPNMDSAHGLNSLQQIAVGSMQQNHVGAPQQANISSMSSQNGVNVLQPNMSSLQSNSGMLQQNLKHQPEHQMMHSQQFKNLHHQRMMIQKQQILQQQQQQQQQQHHQQPPQLSQQAKQQLPAQLQTNQHQMSQLHQNSDASDLKIRPSMGVRPGVFQQQFSAGQRSALSQQQLKSGSQFPMSSNQLLQATSPQILQHSSPQVDQSNLLPSLTKPVTPLQSANSPFVVPSPPTPLAPSPMPGDLEKPASGISSLSNAANVGQQQTSSVVAPAQSLAIGTPGISASPLLAEFIGPDGVHGNSLASISGKSSATEHPLERLIKSVKSMSPKALSASVSDIGSVVSMTDRIAGSAPGNGSRAAVGEDLVAMTKCRLQAKNFMTQDGANGTRKMRRYTSAMPLNVVSSAGSRNDSFKNLNGSEASDLESTATSGIKRPRIEAKHALVEEIKQINQRLIDTVLEISDQDVNSSLAAGPVGGEGTIVKCSFSAVALSPNLKSQYSSAQMSPIQPLRLLVPTNYPNCSPILLDKFPVEVSKEYEDLSVKAKSKFSISLRSLSQPMSLGEIARTWDVCARVVLSEYAQQSGGGSFSSKYGTWEHCLSAA